MARINEADRVDVSLSKVMTVVPTLPRSKKANGSVNAWATKTRGTVALGLK